MKFCEKLQTLRKERKMSQEQLADMLDVSRQAVSKWEIGTSYPEMDKLLQLCKIFGCSLDDLTNDEVNVINIKENSKVTVSGVVDQFLMVIRKCYFCVTNMSFKEVIKMIFELLILVGVLALLSLPFNMIASSIRSVTYRNEFFLFDLLGSGLYVIIMIIYAILAIIILGYVIKLRYLDNCEEKIVIKKEDVETTSEGDKVSLKVLETKRSSLIDLLVNIIVLFMKFVSCIIMLFVIFFIVFLAICLAILIVGLFHEIVFVGLILGLISLIVIACCVFEISFKFIFNVKANYKRIFLTSLISLMGLGLGIGFTFGEFTRYEIIDEIPDYYEVVDREKEFTYQEGLYLRNYYGVEKVDNSLDDDVIVFKYKDSKYSSADIFIDGNVLSSSIDFRFFGKEFFDKFIENLQDRKIYTFNDLELYRMNIYANDNTWKKLHTNEAEMIKNEHNSYQECATDIEDYYEEKLDELERENEELKQEIEEYIEKLDNLREALRN